ncbi:MAG: sugar phosphate isomerase/epimerase family protein [Mycobacteriales bacterium]
MTHTPVLLSSASVYPERAAGAFEIAAALGYDGVEVMVWADPTSQDTDALSKLSHRYGMPIFAVHAPCLIISQRVWSRDPVTRLHLAVQAAVRVGAPTVVVHLPFRWQRAYARGFAQQVHDLETRHGVAVAVENMFPLRARARQWCPYSQHWDPSVIGGFSNYTLDLSHAAVARADALEITERMGAQLRHVHLADGTGMGRDQHLMPGQGSQPCGPLLQQLAAGGFTGAVAVEASTRTATSRQQREAELAAALDFARTHLATTPHTPVRAPAPA